jgi:hypothetical protein
LTHRRIRLLSLAGTAALIVLLTACSSSGRAVGFTTGFSADPVLTAISPPLRATWIQRAVGEGAGIVRVNINWSEVAPRVRPPGFNPADPASPGYNWAFADAAVTQLERSGLQVLIDIVLAPKWAEGANKPRAERSGTWRPDPTQFAAFATAAARRYSGTFDGLPPVKYWEAWNEPNLDFYLSPQWTRVRHRWVLTGADMYRRLLNSFYAAVKGVSSSNVVLGGSTSPYGDTIGTDARGQERTPPVTFVRALFCRCADPPHLDALDHHPYGIGGPLAHAFNAGDAAVPDIYKLARVLHAAERTRHVLPGGSKQLWVTEISWDSDPPDPQGVPIQRQARWFEQAMYVLWKQGVDTVLFLEIADAPCKPSCPSTYQAGIYYRSGQPKPSAVAYRFPFVTSRVRGRKLQVWGRSPVAGTVRVEVRRGRRWAVVRQFRVGAQRVFVGDLAVRGPAVLRAEVGGERSLTWSQGP